MITWKTVRVFISSTFKDMHAERDYLVKHVFPELAQWCEERLIRFYDVDLRWGVTTDDEENENAVTTCLDSIDDCRPFFLCFLGQRRGWIPFQRENDIQQNIIAKVMIQKTGWGETKWIDNVKLPVKFYTSNGKPYMKDDAGTVTELYTIKD